MSVLLSDLIKELDFSVARSSGPGGQNVNKVNSKAIVHWNPETSQLMNQEVRMRFFNLFANKLTKTGELVISSDEYRDLKRNQQNCAEKILAMIQKAMERPKKRIKTKRTRSSNEYRLASKKILKEKKRQRKMDW